MLTAVLSPGLRQDLDHLAEWPRTKTGRRSPVTRKRRPRAQRPRIARRFVPQHSLAHTLDWDLTPSQRLCLAYLLSCTRDGLTIHGLYAATIATQFGVAPCTARRWLRALEEEGYLLCRPGRLRGSLVITFTSKATTWCQVRDADLRPKQKSENVGNPRVSDRPRAFSLTLKDKSKKEAQEGAVDK